jgi:hypothetical protein
MNYSTTPSPAQYVRDLMHEVMKDIAESHSVPQYLLVNAVDPEIPQELVMALQPLIEHQRAESEGAAKLRAMDEGTSYEQFREITAAVAKADKAIMAEAILIAFMIGLKTGRRVG